MAPVPRSWLSETSASKNRLRPPWESPGRSGNPPAMVEKGVEPRIVDRPGAEDAGLCDRGVKRRDPEPEVPLDRRAHRRVEGDGDLPFRGSRAPEAAARTARRKKGSGMSAAGLHRGTLSRGDPRFHRREGDGGDVPGRPLDLRRVVPDVRVQPRDDRPGVPVEQALSEDAEDVSPDLLVGGAAPHDLPDKAPQRSVDGQDRPVDHLAEGARRLDDLPRHQLPEPRRAPLVENAKEEKADEAREPALRRPRATGKVALGVLLARLAVGEFEHVGVEVLLPLEIVVDRCDVDAGPAADLPDGGAPVSPLGEDLPRGVEQPLAGPFREELSLGVRRRAG